MKQSESIAALAASLSALQGELSHVGKNSHGYGYDYADLAAVLDVARPLLAKHGLALAQYPAESDGDCVALESILMHSSGEWISSRYTMTVEQGKGMSKAQAVGSVITYARRYALTAILGIAQTDNDAATAPQPEKKKPQGKPEKRTQISTGAPPVNPNGPTDKQVGMIWAQAQERWGEAAKEELKAMCTRRGYPESSRDMTREQASELIGHLVSLNGGGEK